MVLVLALVVALAPTVRAQPPPPLVLVYGDSLVWEARTYLHNELHDVGHVMDKITALPGEATCDALDIMRDDAARYHPALVIIDFSGNSITPCMKDARGNQLEGQAAIDKYREDTITAISIFRYRKDPPQIWLGTAPVTLPETAKNDDFQARMAAMLRSLPPLNSRVRVVDAAQAVLNRGAWTATLPCLPNEPCQWGVDANGYRVNRVRSNDGTHFCPLSYVQNQECAMHSSGGLRYALALATAPLKSRGWWDQRAADLSIGAGFIAPG